MARKKKQVSLDATAGNYYPSVEGIGLKNRYIYYTSLLHGDDKRYATNREIGKEAENYLNNIQNNLLSNPKDSSSGGESRVKQAIDLLYKAYLNESKKEKAWLE